MDFGLAILNILAKCPEGRASFDELKRELGIAFDAGDGIEQAKRLAALGKTDVFQSGCVLQDDAGLQITDEGLSLLTALESSGEASLGAPSAPASRMIDDLIGAEERSKIFGLGLRALDGSFEDPDDSEPAQDQDQFAAIGMPDATSEAYAPDLAGRIEAQIHDGPDYRGDGQSSPDAGNPTTAIEPSESAAEDVPAFLRRRFGSRDPKPLRNLERPSNAFAVMALKARSLLDLFQRYSIQRPLGEDVGRPAGTVGGAAFALLSLLTVIACAGAAIALGQIRSLKSEVTMLQRELVPLRERLAELDQAEKMNRASVEQRQAQNKSYTERNKSAGDVRSDQSALNLSPEEIQLIRNYIKPAPVAGATAAPPLNVGDPVTGATIPLPSPLTETIPKLQGGRFTTRDGAIVIIRRDSHQVDAVLPPR